MEKSRSSAVSPYSYEVHLPSGYVPGRRYPALFTLHGKGSNEQNMFGLVEPLAEEFIIIGIRGDLTLGPGYQYYELVSLGNPVREQFDRAVRQLEAVIDEITSSEPVDPERRCLLGFSQGAILSMTLALVMGSRLKGIVSLNGYVPDFVKSEYQLQSLEKVSLFISHGQYDPLFPAEIGHETAAYFQALTSNVVFNMYPNGHEVSRQNQQDFLSWLQADIKQE
ncbi:alpha/beta hydrolase [Paenibacillus pinistramenti]|uniref:alpha/beta hydrolase n=1 Tax=Paenibacillus pinistramenti TaxID=1768003 RepID=UPI001108D1CC|nr:dienelactone hydrolase family protein [Paenibacillus pinistramenti]